MDKLTDVQLREHTKLFGMNEVETTKFIRMVRNITIDHNRFYSREMVSFYYGKLCVTRLDSREVSNCRAPVIVVKNNSSELIGLLQQPIVPDFEVGSIIHMHYNNLFLPSKRCKYHYSKGIVRIKEITDKHIVTEFKFRKKTYNETFDKAEIIKGLKRSSIFIIPETYKTEIYKFTDNYTGKQWI